MKPVPNMNYMCSVGC